MDITIQPKKLNGIVRAIPSKSYAHRLLICSAFADAPTQIDCPETNADITATVSCLRALGTRIEKTCTGYSVTPIKAVPQSAILDCGESGSTLRFLLPIAGALGVEATFLMSGKLPQRPLSPLWEEMERMGCFLSRPNEYSILCRGKLRAGTYTIAGNVSSQFITGLLFASALISGECSVKITGKLESEPYVLMTKEALRLFSVDAECCAQTFISPGSISVEGDWSNSAFFLAAASFGNCVTVTGLNVDSIQGDKKITSLLPALQQGFANIDAMDIPDLVPILAVTAGTLHGATFKNIQRLRYKESDRVASTAQMLQNLGARVVVTEDSLTVHPARYLGCTIDAHNDHRIAMSAAVAASIADGPVTILGAQCVNKSYPTFWEQYRNLGGIYEQYIR